MSIFATLIGWIASKLAALYIASQASRLVARMSVLGAIAAGYVALVVLFSTTVAPLWSSIVGSAYGQVLGLLFPPVAGTILASLAGFWTAVVVWRYWAALGAASVR